MLALGELHLSEARWLPMDAYKRDSWNRDLANQRGIHMGGEFRMKGVNIALGPVISPLGRMAEGGRNWEGCFVLIS